MKFTLFFGVCFYLVKNGLTDNSTKGFIDAKLNESYNGTVKNGLEDIYFFNLTNSALHENGVSTLYSIVEKI